MDESDDEETIEKEEQEGTDEVRTHDARVLAFALFQSKKIRFPSVTKTKLFQASQKAEIDALQKESEMSIEELLKNLPQEVLEKPASLRGESTDDSGDDADDEAETTKVREIDTT